MGPDEPTRRIPPQPPAAAPDPSGTRIRETTYAAPDPAYEQLLDRIRSLQTALALVGVLAAAALGVALWVLLSEDEESGSRGASSERVSSLEDRVDSLEDRIDDRATKNSVAQLSSDVERLEGDVEEAASSGNEDDAQQAVEDLRGDLDQLSQRVDELAQQEPQQEGTTTTPE